MQAAVGRVFKALYEQQAALGIKLKPDIKVAATLKPMEGDLLAEATAAVVGRSLQVRGSALTMK